MGSKSIQMAYFHPFSTQNITDGETVYLFLHPFVAVVGIATPNGVPSCNFFPELHSCFEVSLQMEMDPQSELTVEWK